MHNTMNLYAIEISGRCAITRPSLAEAGRAYLAMPSSFRNRARVISRGRDVTAAAELAGL